jgi:PPOX class probable F420-dependent enzyme
MSSTRGWQSRRRLRCWRDLGASSPTRRRWITQRGRRRSASALPTSRCATSLGAGGQPHVMPVWFVLDGEELVFTTWGDSVKGRNLRRNPRAAVIVDKEAAPHAFVHIRGHVKLSEDLEELLRFATAIGGRYMGGDRAGEFGRRMPCWASCWCGSNRSV